MREQENHRIFLGQMPGSRANDPSFALYHQEGNGREASALYAHESADFIRGYLEGLTLAAPLTFRSVIFNGIPDAFCKEFETEEGGLTRFERPTTIARETLGTLYWQPWLIYNMDNE